MFHHFLTETQEVNETISQFFTPTVIAAMIAAIVALFSVLLNFKNLRLQRLESERQEIYKKLNSFYGPMRLHLNTSKKLYELFKNSIKKNLSDPDNFRTLPFILQGQKFNKTEKELFAQIIRIGRKMESIINQNAGLIDDDDLHEEMIKLKTHIIIIRSAYEQKFEIKKEVEELLSSQTFPDDILGNVDATFNELKKQLARLNKKKIVAKNKKKHRKKNKTNNSPSQE